MLRILIAIILVVVFVLIWKQFKARRAAAQKRTTSAYKPPASPFRDEFTDTANNPDAAKIGDVVELTGTVGHNGSYYLREVVNYNEDGFKWRELLLDSGTSRIWLSAERDPNLELIIWEDVGDHDLNPGDTTLTLGGTPFTRKERGTAIFHSTSGTEGMPRSGSCKYLDYKAKDGRRLSFESWGESSDKWEASVGTEVLPAHVTIMPAYKPPAGTA